jgi:type IV pilus assembly protein PilW
MNARLRPRGFTLIEVMVAIAVSALVVAGVVAAVLSQQRAFYGSHRLRAAQSSGRAALLFVEDKLRIAGFGMDPALAFDFQFYVNGPCPGDVGTCPRDAINNSDELVFYARNPNYWVPPNNTTGNPVGRAWRIPAGSTITATSVTIRANANDSIPAGQILAAVCPGGRYYTYMTVATSFSQGIAAGDANVMLATVDTANPFKRQDLAVSPGSGTPAYFNLAASAAASTIAPSSCFSSGEARLFQIDRYRFHVRPVQVGTWPDGKVKYDPYLMLDMGIDTNGDTFIDANDEMVVAEGIEIMQVAYTLANSALSTPTVGVTAGTAITFTQGLPGLTTSSNRLTTVQLPPTLPVTFTFAPTITPVDNPYAVWSWYPYTITPPFPSGYPRLTDSQANIRRVRVAFVARSPEPDLQSITPILLDSAFELYNLDTVPSWISANAYPSASDGYQRVQLETNVLVPNMTIRGMSYF